MWPASRQRMERMKAVMAHASVNREENRILTDFSVVQIWERKHELFL